MRVLVSGGAGFIGSHLSTALVKAGYEVRVLDNFSTGKRENLAGLPVELVEGDVADWECVQTAVHGCHLIFHLAALVSVPLSIKEPTLNHTSNVTGTYHIFEAARQSGVGRVIYASSAAVYGNIPTLPKRESDPLALLTPYAMAKRTAELMAATYWHAYQLESVGLRFMNVFGPRQDPSSPYSGVLSIFCHKLLNQEPLTIYGDGEQTRDFVFVDDVVQALLLSATANSPEVQFPAIYNIGSGTQTSLNQIVEKLGTVAHTAVHTNYLDTREGDIKHSVADINLAIQQLGYHPQTSLLSGLEATFTWYKNDI